MTKTKKICCYTALIVISILSVFPIYWMFISATNTNADILSAKLTPGNHFFENLRTLLDSQNIAKGMANSLRNSVVQTVISLLITSMAGYGFEIYHDKWKDRLLSVLMLAMMIPMISIVIPLFRLFSGWKLLNTMIACILPSLATPFLIMFFRSAARSFPIELIDAARMDGVSEIGIFFKMFIPTMKSTYGAAMTIIFMNSWNNYLWPRIALMSNESMTMPLLISNMNTGYVIDYGMIMLGVAISTVPTIIIFLLLQKSFANGVVGAVK